MRRTILLLATVALALLLIGGVAASKQQQEEQSTSRSSTTSDKSGGEVSIQSTTNKASFASGSGANFLGVKVSDHGNLTSFESPAGKEHVFAGREGYAVCTNLIPLQAYGHDTGDVEGGFGTPTFSQPNGAGTFPLTVTRNTTDGKFQLKQVWNKPDAAEKDVTLTMTLKNRTSSTLADVLLTRSGDFDVGGSVTDQGGASTDSAWLWDDVSSGIGSPYVGLKLTALTFGTTHNGYIVPEANWYNQSSGNRLNCNGANPPSPGTRAAFAMQMTYHLGNLGAGQSKTVKLLYGRM
jgi:hypothetical protein